MKVLRALANPVLRMLEKTGPIVAKVTKGRISRFGVTIDTPGIHKVIQATLFWGYYERSERRAIARHMRSDLPVIELGSGIGFVSVLIAKRLRSKQQVAVDGNPKAIPILANTLRINGCDNVKVILGAIAYSGSESVAMEKADVYVFSRLASMATPNRDGKKVVDVNDIPAITLSQILDSEGIGDFVLVSDIEGAELELIESEASAAGRLCQQAIMELHYIERGGVQWGPEQIAERICELWGMRVVGTEGHVWVFER